MGSQKYQNHHQTELAKQFSVPIIDVAPILRTFGLNQSDAFLDEMHPTAQANHWVAQSIADEWSQVDNPLTEWVPTITESTKIEIEDRWSSE